MLHYNMMNRIGDVLKKPNAVWSDIAKEKGIDDAAIFLAVLAVLSGILEIGVDFFMGDSAFLTYGFPASIAHSLSLTHPAAIALIAVVFGSLLTLLGSFMGAALLRGGAAILRMSVTYGDAFRVSAYSMTPSLLLGAVPIVGDFAGLWTLLLFIDGIRNTFRVSLGKAIGLFLLVGIGVFLLAAIIGFALAQSISFS